MKKINAYMVFQWIVFLPLILSLGIISGAIEGIRKTLEQAANDIINYEVPS